MDSTPLKEHEWLQRLVDDWIVEGEATMEPGKPPEKYSGAETVRSLGGLWILAEGQGDMPGCGPATTLTTLGFDPGKGRFVGTFVGSMMTSMWLYEGELDEAQRVLTLSTEGPNMGAEGTLAKYRDIMELTDDDHRALTSQILGEDGQWHEFMRASYRRGK